VLYRSSNLAGSSSSFFLRFCFDDLRCSDEEIYLQTLGCIGYLVVHVDVAMQHVDVSFDFFPVVVVVVVVQNLRDVQISALFDGNGRTLNAVVLAVFEHNLLSILHYSPTTNGVRNQAADQQNSDGQYGRQIAAFLQNLSLLADPGFPQDKAAKMLLLLATVLVAHAHKPMELT